MRFHPRVMRDPERLPSGRDDAFWRAYLTRGTPTRRRHRQMLKHLPRAPRCRLCAAPFAGVGGPMMRLVGRGPSAQNPTICALCFSFIAKQHGGAEIECSMLFADIRGSTALAESMPPAAFRDLLDRFFTAACAVIVHNDGMIDKFVGDELVALFVPAISGDRHSRFAVTAAQELMRVTGDGSGEGSWVGLGIGVHTASVWFGAVGEGAHREVTAVGDGMNVTARLASAADPGEILVTTAAASAAGLDPTLNRRELTIRGRTAPVAVVRVQAAS